MPKWIVAAARSVTNRFRMLTDWLPTFVKRAPLIALLLPATVLVSLASGETPAADASAGPLRVACVGDSITFGSGTAIPGLESYPAQLQRMLDWHKWRVGDYGVSGATLMNRGDKPYQKQTAFKDALTFNPNIVVIMLGTNDTKPDNWQFKADYVDDYADLIAKFRALPSHPRIFLCRPPIVTGPGAYGINERGIQEEIPLIDGLAKKENLTVIDMHAPLEGRDPLLPDHVHPNTAGANVLARTVYHALTGAAFTGALDPLLHDEWMGFPRVSFAVGYRVGFIVFPKTQARGQPWIWRPEFFGVEPQTEIALLKQGWSAAYVDVRNLYGAPPALDVMDAFYARATAEFRLNKKVVLAGFSRGGLFAFNWAVRHPIDVACIYADAPVLDFKSWPAGRGKGAGSPADWQRLLKAYGMTEAQALAYSLNPIDNLKPLAAAHIPILCVCGGADKTVPFEENAGLLESRYKHLGGEVQVIVKPGGDHHPHSLPDPTPIVNFIVQHGPHVL